MVYLFYKKNCKLIASLVLYDRCFGCRSNTSAFKDAKFAKKDHRKRLKTDGAYIKIKKCGIRKKLLISYNAET